MRVMHRLVDMEIIYSLKELINNSNQSYIYYKSMFFPVTLLKVHSILLLEDTSLTGDINVNGRGDLAANTMEFNYYVEHCSANTIHPRLCIEQ